MLTGRPEALHEMLTGLPEAAHVESVIVEFCGIT